MDILNYGGGRQTVAMCILIVDGLLERPDRVVIADTGRENPSTWEYLDQFVQPLLAQVGLTVEVAPRALATVDLYGHNGDLLVPVYTEKGKLSAYCSTEWKSRVLQRYLAADCPPRDRVHWIGFAYDERRRVKASRDVLRYPLIERVLAKADCRAIIERAGLPLPAPSSCVMCPHKSNTQWRSIRDDYPEAWRQACAIDAELREQDIFAGNSGVWLHASRVPLAEADIDDDDRRDGAVNGRQCALGMCFV